MTFALETRAARRRRGRQVRASAGGPTRPPHAEGWRVDSVHRHSWHSLARPHTFDQDAVAKIKNGRERTGANLGFDATLWAAADALRNNMDAAEYKDLPPT
jgi:hypothetical protein